MKIFLFCFLLVTLIACATTRQRVVIVNVKEYPAKYDSASVVPPETFEEMVKREEKKKNFWRGVTAVLIIIIVIELFTQ